MRIAELGRIPALQQGLHAVVRGNHQAAVVQGHLHMASASARLARIQRGEDRLRRIHAGEHVDRGHAELQRSLAGFAVGGHHAGLALDDQVVAWPFGLGREAGVAGDRAVHQPGIELGQLFVAQAQLFRTADLEVLDHHVAARGQLAGQLQARFALQVQRDRALVAVGAVEVRGIARADAQAPVAGVIAAGRVFDLDDVGAEVGQRHRAHRPRQHARQVQYPHAGQRQRCGIVFVMHGQRPLPGDDPVFLVSADCLYVDKV